MNDKIQGQMAGGETLQKGTELYNEWLKNQMNMFNSFTKNAKNGANAAETITENTKAATDMYNNWLNTQMEAANKWSDTMKNLFTDFYTQNQNAYKSFGNVTNMQDAWMNAYKTMNENMTNSFKGLTNNFSLESTKEIFNNMLKGNDVYQKVYEFWTNATKNMQGGNFSMENFKNAFDPMGYKTILDKLFGFDASGQVKEFFNNTTRTIQDFQANMHKMSKNFQNMYQGEGNLFTGMLPVDMQAMTEMYKTYFNNLRSSFSPFFKLATPGKETELAEVAMDIVDNYALFMMKGAQMQHMIYNAGNKAMEEVMNELQNKVKEGAEFTSFQAFYAEWTSINERIYTEFFNTDEFSQLQADLIKIDLEIKDAYKKQMEIFLQPFPVVLTKQMDEVYETNYELRKRVRSLEKTVKELQAMITDQAYNKTTAKASHEEEDQKASSNGKAPKATTASAKK
jgi:hypothetical protein